MINKKKLEEKVKVTPSQNQNQKECRNQNRLNILSKRASQWRGYKQERLINNNGKVSVHNAIKVPQVMLDRKHVFFWII